MALLVVLGAMVMITAILLTTLALTLQTSRPTRADQDAKTAVAAAQAGIDEYVSRLTANDNYWSSTDASNAAFTTGQTIRGVGGNGAKYAYTVLNSPSDIAASGQIKLKVTGTSSPGGGQPSVSRTFVATLQVRGFLSYVYLSDIEVIDPDLNNTNAACKTYYYTGRSARNDCSEIQWAGNDVLNGALHSNDALQIAGKVSFLGRATSSWPWINGRSGITWWGSYTGSLAPNYSPQYAAAVDLPVSNATLLQNVSPDVDGNASTPAGPGCYYQGATAIEFQGTSMRVLSPGTSRADTPSRCLTVADRTNWQVITPIPPVIYVDANSAACVYRATGYPVTGEDVVTGSANAITWSTSNGGRIPNYTCNRGSAYVKGTVNGAVTVSAADDVVITGDLRAGSLAGTDVIGLIGGNCVWVYHPVTAARDNILASPPDDINAAILALRHSFLVSNWNAGGVVGTLRVTGAIAQKFRGPVATSSNGNLVTGYAKQYVYDTRLQNLQPPYFLKPTTTPWKVSSLIDS